jgi:hypothetical protein
VSSRRRYFHVVDVATGEAFGQNCLRSDSLRLPVLISPGTIRFWLSEVM